MRVRPDCYWHAPLPDLAKYIAAVAPLTSRVYLTPTWVKPQTEVNDRFSISNSAVASALNRRLSNLLADTTPGSARGHSVNSEESFFHGAALHRVAAVHTTAMPAPRHTAGGNIHGRL